MKRLFIVSEIYEQKIPIRHQHAKISEFYTPDDIELIINHHYYGDFFASAKRLSSFGSLSAAWALVDRQPKVWTSVRNRLLNALIYTVEEYLFNDEKWDEAHGNLDKLLARYSGAYNFDARIAAAHPYIPLSLREDNNSDLERIADDLAGEGWKVANCDKMQRAYQLTDAELASIVAQWTRNEELLDKGAM